MKRSMRSFVIDNAGLIGTAVFLLPTWTVIADLSPGRASGYALVLIPALVCPGLIVCSRFRLVEKVALILGIWVLLFVQIIVLAILTFGRHPL